MSQKLEFVERATAPGANVSEPCRELGISRQTGHKWIRRYRDHGYLGLVQLRMLLDAGEVATRLGVCRDTVYELCKRGALRHVRVLNAIRVHPADLAEFMAGKPR